MNELHETICAAKILLLRQGDIDGKIYTTDSMLEKFGLSAEKLGCAVENGFVEIKNCHSQTKAESSSLETMDFELRVQPDRIKKFLNEKINLFIKDELDLSDYPSQNLFSYEKQKNDFISAIMILVGKGFSSKNFKISHYGIWNVRRASLVETALAIEKEGLISIKDILTVPEERIIMDIISEKLLPHNKPKTAPNIYYNKQTGVGIVDEKKFKFKNRQPEFNVFGELYEKMGQPVRRKEVLALADYDDEDKPDIAGDLFKDTRMKKSGSSTTATYFINELAKKIRSRTGLTPEYLVVSDGDLTLSGNKLEKPPM